MSLRDLNNSSNFVYGQFLGGPFISSHPVKGSVELADLSLLQIIKEPLEVSLNHGTFWLEKRNQYFSINTFFCI